MCIRDCVHGARVASLPRPTVEFELVRALAHELRYREWGIVMGATDEQFELGFDKKKERDNAAG